MTGGAGILTTQARAPGQSGRKRVLADCASIAKVTLSLHPERCQVRFAAPLVLVIVCFAARAYFLRWSGCSLRHCRTCGKGLQKGLSSSCFLLGLEQDLQDDAFLERPCRSLLRPSGLCIPRSRRFRRLSASCMSANQFSGAAFPDIIGDADKLGVARPRPRTG
jgi:hypothetical protein